jgi:uncharacterized membrane protein
MTTLSQAKAMGGVGSILVLLSVVPSVGFILGIAGLVMVLLAVKQISDAVNEREIFNNVLMAVILQIVGIGILTFAVIGGVLSMFLIPSGPFFDGFTDSSMMGEGAVFAFLGFFVVGLIAMWIVLIIAARFLRRGYERIAERTGTGMFGTVGRWYFYGALLLIVLVGFIIILIAEILQIVAFFSLPESLPTQPGPQQPTGVQPI